MKGYNIEETQERRKKRIFTPLIYFLSELIFTWLIISIINLSFNILLWENWSYIAMLTIFVHTAYKTYTMYDRQKDLKYTE
jgi:uncharacterized membrane protein YdbT with pleckstrin-like domain